MATDRFGGAETKILKRFLATAAVGATGYPDFAVAAQYRG
jgi:hypothetical protein